MTRHQRFPPLMIIYIILGAISIFGSIFVSITLTRYGALKTTITRLLLLLHLSLLAEEFTIIPYIYDYNFSVCTMIEFFHFYFGLQNTIVILLLVLTYRYLFFNDVMGINTIIQKYDIFIVLVVPLLTFLGFIGKIYSRDNGDFCTPSIQRIDSNRWSILIFYVWVWIAEFAATFVLGTTMYGVYIKDSTMGHKMLSTVGLYNIIAVVCCIPRTIFRIAQIGNPTHNKFAIVIGSYIPVYISGILYTLVFLREHKALAMFNNYHTETTTDSLHSVGSLSFSWEGLGIDVDSNQHDTTSTQRSNSSRLTLTSVISQDTSSRPSSNTVISQLIKNEIEASQPKGRQEYEMSLSRNNTNNGSISSVVNPIIHSNSDNNVVLNNIDSEEV